MTKLKPFLIAVVFASVCFAANAQIVTLNHTNVKLDVVFADITAQTGFSVNYARPTINPERIVSIDVKAVELEVALQRLFAGSDIGYEIGDKKIFLSSKKQQSEQKGRRTVSGIVTDHNGEPIIGAAVTVKGTLTGTSTSVDGSYSITVVGEGAVLEFSYLGFNNRQVKVTNSTVNVTMVENNQLIDEVVVVGYGTQKKSDITGSVGSVKAAELVSAPLPNTAQALQGRISGVMVQNSSGTPSGDITIRIRGANSLTYGNDPLVIIDGVQDANLGSLNPNEVESMEVLKDAAALSIYGSRGANGVILVTTKSGAKLSRTVVSYNGYVSFDKVSKTLPSMNATEYANLFNEYREENGQSAFFSTEQIAAMGKGTAWQNEIFRNAVSQSHNISIGGSSDKVSYFVAGNILNKEGIMINSDFSQFSLRSNLKIKATDYFTFGINAFASSSDSSQGEAGSAIVSALQWSPTKTVYDSDGKYTQPGGGVGPTSNYNPVALAKEMVNDSESTQFSISPMAELRLSKHLTLSSQLVYKHNSNQNGYFDNQVTNNGPVSNTQGSMSTSRYTAWQNTNILTWERSFGDHTIKATGVYEISQDKYQANYSAAKGVPVGLGYNGLQFGSTMLQPWITYSATAMSSFMGRINYSYKNRYMFSISDRYDGASQLADGHKYENFWAVSAGWNIAEEPFWENLRGFMPELKLRGSYGSVGNAAVPAYSSQLKFSAGLDADSNPVLTVSQLSNSDLRWERTTEANIGVDTKLFGGRITVSAEYYHKHTTDLLMWQKVPSALGVKSVLKNVGAVSNKGFDVSVSGYVIDTKGFAWNTTVTFNNNRNKILALDGMSDTIVYESDADYPGTVGSFVQQVGQPMGTFLGYKFRGVWKSTEASTAALYGAKPGDAKYEDVDKNHVIDSKDIQIIGNAQPKYIYGWNNTFTLGGFDVNIFWQGVAGNQIYNQNRIRRESSSSTFPAGTTVMNRWTPTNDNTDVPSFTGAENINSSRWVEDGSYLRLKNLSVGYRFSEQMLSKTKLISSARIYVSANNYLTFTKYSGYDPEASLGDDATAAGVDRGIYPSAKSIVLGIDLSF